MGIRAESGTQIPTPQMSYFEEHGLMAIREHSQYILRNTIRAGCIHESWLFFNEMAKGAGSEEVRHALVDGKLLGKYAYSTRTALWKIFRTRYLNISDPWVLSELISASRHGPESPEFVSLLYLYFVLRDKLAFDFVVDVIWEKWLNHDLAIGSGDCSRFYSRLSEENDSLRKITAESKGKLIRNTVSTLKNFGLVTRERHRSISRPAVALRTAFHLVRLLKLEGLSGKGVVDARDWRLFLWDKSDISRSLNRLAQEQWIRYEGSGQVIILELIENEARIEPHD
ncbi:MAG: BrxA family protein [Pseudomonadota bacterium]